LNKILSYCSHNPAVWQVVDNRPSRSLLMSVPDRNWRSGYHHQYKAKHISCGVLNALPFCRIAPFSHMSSTCWPRSQDLRLNAHQSASRLLPGRLLKASVCCDIGLQATSGKQVDQNGSLPPPPPGSTPNPLHFSCETSTCHFCQNPLLHYIALQLASPGRVHNS